MLGQSSDVNAGNLTFATAIGASAVATASNRIQLGRNGTDTVSIGLLTSASATAVCINGTVLSSCSSSQRYKDRVQPLSSGLNLIGRLRPVTFDWKERDEADLGLIAEEVAKVEPLLDHFTKSDFPQHLLQKNHSTPRCNLFIRIAYLKFHSIFSLTLRFRDYTPICTKFPYCVIWVKVGLDETEFQTASFKTGEKNETPSIDYPFCS